MKSGRAAFRKAVKGGEEDALETLVELFDWLDSLEPQPMMNIVSEGQKNRSVIADTHTSMDQDIVVGKAEVSAVSCPPCLHLMPKSYVDWE